MHENHIAWPKTDSCNESRELISKAIGGANGINLWAETRPRLDVIGRLAARCRTMEAENRLKSQGFRAF